jgi:hypothetical protein
MITCNLLFAEVRSVECGIRSTKYGVARGGLSGLGFLQESGKVRGLVHFPARRCILLGNGRQKTWICPLPFRTLQLSWGFLGRRNQLVSGVVYLWRGLRRGCAWWPVTLSVRKRRPPHSLPAAFSEWLAIDGGIAQNGKHIPRAVGPRLLRHCQADIQ